MGELSLQQLSDLRSELEREVARFSSVRFPKDCCTYVATRAQRSLDLNVVSGLFIDGDEIGHNHTWNETSEGYIVDLTASQFSGNFPQVYVLPKDSHEAKERYWPGVFYMY